MSAAQGTASSRRLLSRNLYWICTLGLVVLYETAWRAIAFDWREWAPVVAACFVFVHLDGRAERRGRRGFARYWPSGLAALGALVLGMLAVELL